MNTLEKIRLYCSANEIGKISDADFKGLVRETMGLRNKKSVSGTAKVRIDSHLKSDLYKNWLYKYFPEENTKGIEVKHTPILERVMPSILKAREIPTEVPEKEPIKDIVHIDTKVTKKPIVS